VCFSNAQDKFVGEAGDAGAAAIVIYGCTCDAWEMSDGDTSKPETHIMRVAVRCYTPQHRNRPPILALAPLLLPKLWENVRLFDPTPVPP